MANTETSLKEATTSIEGAIGAALVDYTSGMALGTLGGGKDLDLDVAAAGNTDVVRAKLRTMEHPGPQGRDRGHPDHPRQPVPPDPAAQGRNSNGLFLYLALDKDRANLAMARHQLKRSRRTGRLSRARTGRRARRRAGPSGPARPRVTPRRRPCSLHEQPPRRRPRVELLQPGLRVRQAVAHGLQQDPAQQHRGARGVEGEARCRRRPGGAGRCGRRPGRTRESATVTTVSPAARAWASASTTSRGWRGSAKHRSALAPARTAASMRSASIVPPSSSSRTSGWTLAAK